MIVEVVSGIRDGICPVLDIASWLIYVDFVQRCIIFL
jgi:hypothetical protein